jgi:hypothetical protein
MRSIAGLLVAAAACAVPALAMGAEDLAAAVRACSTEPNDGRRLVCYDRAVGHVQAPEPAASPRAAAPPVAPEPGAAPAAATAATSAAAAPAEDNFGRERQLAYEEDQKREEATRAVGELQSSIAGIEKRMDGLMTFTLDNGQVWRQVRPDSKFSIKQGDAIRIQPGSLGSFILSGPTKKSTRVTRVK